MKIVSEGSGIVGTCTIYLNQNHKTAEIGLMIGELSLHNKGFGSEAVRLLTRFCCDELGVRKVSAGVYASNQGSLKVFLKNGYRIECRLTAQVLFGDAPEDVCRLAYFNDFHQSPQSK